MTPKLKVPPDLTMMGFLFQSKHGVEGALLRSIFDAFVHGKMAHVMAGFHYDDITMRARNSLAIQAIEIGAEWLWFVDSDADFPPETLERLKACDADIACTDMWSRNWPSFRTVLEYAPKKRFRKREFVPVAMGGEVKGVRDVDCCGMHCTLIRVSLLRKFLKDKRAPFIQTNNGEDANFCIMAKQKYKAKIRCDFDVVSGHWGRCRMTGQDFTRDARNRVGTIVEPEMMSRMGVSHLDEPSRA